MVKVCSDGFALLQWLLDLPFAMVLKEVASVVGYDTSTPVVPHTVTPVVKSETDNADEDERRANSIKSFGRRLDLPDKGIKIIDQYFRGRSIPFISCWTFNGPNGLLFHPKALTNDDDGNLKAFPTMVAPVLSPDGKKVLTYHRTFLEQIQEPDGTLKVVKANIEHPKKLMAIPSYSTLRGSAIHLREASGPDLAICEGIETAVAVFVLNNLPSLRGRLGLAFKYLEGHPYMAKRNLPVWAVLNAGNMKHFVPPEGVERLHVYADLDPSTQAHPNGIGLEAAQELQHTLKDRCEVYIYLPPMLVPDGVKGVDWLDYLAQVTRCFRQ
jgi:hypothetical protein